MLHGLDRMILGHDEDEADEVDASDAFQTGERGLFVEMFGRKP